MGATWSSEEPHASPTQETTSLMTTKEKYGGADTETAGEEANHAESHDAVKNIGLLGSLSIAVNSLAGPAILQLPFQYQQSGLIPTTLCLIAVAILSNYCSLHMANVVSQVPGNKKFDKMMEFSDPFRIFWNENAYKVTQIFFFLTSVCLNVAAIVDTAQVVDSFLGFHWSSAGLSPTSMEIQTWSHPPCTRKQVKLGICEPFGDEDVYGDYILTAGYVLTAMVFLPVCLMDLKENSNWQIFGFFTLLTTSVYFCAIFSNGKLTLKHVSWWGYSYSGMVGVILFNFALVLAIPAWLHSKKEDVPVRQVVHHSTILSVILYILVGSLGALAIPHVNVNMLKPMVSGAYGQGLQVMGSLFAFFIIGLDIPLFSVLTRYNLVHSGICTDRMANLLVVWIPWGASWLFYQGQAIAELLDWGGVLLTSAVAFLLPLYLALRVLVTTDAEGSIQVYGMPFSRSTQVVLLYALLFVAGATVSLAIIGQIIADETEKHYLESKAYLNDTNVTIMSDAHYPADG